MNLFYLLAGKEEITNLLEPIMTLVGYVIWGIKIIVPIILIVVGMIELTKALINQDEKEIKSAQQKLVKKIIVAICIYLVVTLVSLIMKLIGTDEWKDYTECALDPFSGECDVIPES